jgi:hypothetical protein
MTHHVLGYEHGQELLAIVNGKGEADEFREDGGSPGPRFDDLSAPALHGLLSFLHEVSIHKRPLFQ